MKTSNLFLLAAAGLALTSCSSEEPVNAGNENTTGSQYACFELNLADGLGTRASNEMGTADEYKVSNAKVLVFQKAANEGDATFLSMSDLTDAGWSNGAPGEITSSSRGIARLDDIDLAGSTQYAAIVVLNYKADFVFPTKGQKLSAWTTTEQTSDMQLVNGSTTYLTMTSAPQYVSASAEPTLLADIDKSAVRSTPEAAGSANPAANVYVQRNVAKVSVVNGSSFSGKVDNGARQGDAVTIKGWSLDIKNKKSYAVQVTSGLKSQVAQIWSNSGKYTRFVSGSSFKRCFWAIDPNYNNEITSQSAIESNFITIKTVGDNKPAYEYALENTFDINHQLQGHTTRAVIKAQYTPKGMTAGETFFRIGSSSELWNKTTLSAHMSGICTELLGSATYEVTFSDAFLKAGKHSLNGLKITRNGAELNGAQYNSVAEKLGMVQASNAIISTYENGMTYYAPRVKHFGDAETPWTLNDPTYNGDNERFLGRYGMLRNNWYEVQINSVAGPGEPIVPEIDPTTPDDEKSYYISVSVNILSWTKRTQTEDL